MCAIGSLIITFGSYLAFDQLPVKKTWEAQTVYYLTVLTLTILTTFLMRDEMANVQTIFVFDPRKARRENRKRMQQLEKFASQEEED